jgi:membrane-bound lytic murein transglycosylase B
MMKLFVLLAVVFLYTPTATGQDIEFAQCIAHLQERARSEHVPDWIVDEVMPGLKHQSRVIELDRSQPEFTQTFANYLNRRLTKERVSRGQQLRDQYDLYLSKLTRKYGIPGHYLIAFWGLETNFGSYLGKMPILDCLATLACDTRRSDFFTGELMTALKLLNRESLLPEEMHGSWAGAMGHTQFMPSAYNKYAVDGDEDGQVNLWKSEYDALASGANFLASLGWITGERWGREVILPKDFQYMQSGLSNRKPLRYWADLGVRMTNRSRLPQVDMEASVLVPAGHTGPAFLVWNRSEFYALSVGILADMIAGAMALTHPPSASEKSLSRQNVVDMQKRLIELGFEAGGVDGVFGPATRKALSAFQESNGMIADGHPNNETLQALKIEIEPST